MRSFTAGNANQGRYRAPFNFTWGKLSRGATALVLSLTITHKNASSPSFRINGLGGKCSHIVDSIVTYTYPSVPVGVRAHSFRFMFVFGCEPLTLADSLRRLMRCSTRRLSGARIGNVKERCDARAGRERPETPIPWPHMLLVTRGERISNKKSAGRETKVTRLFRNGN